MLGAAEECVRYLVDMKVRRCPHEEMIVFGLLLVWVWGFQSHPLYAAHELKFVPLLMMVGNNA